MTSNPFQSTCFSFFMPPKHFNKPFEFLLYKINRLHFSVCVYCSRSQKTSRRVKNNMSYSLPLLTCCDVICDLLRCTRTVKCNLFVKYCDFSRSLSPINPTTDANDLLAKHWQFTLFCDS